MPKSSSLLLVLCILLYPSALLGEEPFVCERWAVFEVPLQAQLPRPWEQKFGAVFTHSSGKEMTVPGFFDGGTSWKVRFCPPLEGLWSWTIYAESAQLAGKSGKLFVRATSTPGARRGPVQISKTRTQRFAYADGSPYFALSFELDWLFALDYGNEEQLPQCESILSFLQEQRFNQVVMNVYAYDASWGEREKIRPEHNFAKPTFFPYSGTNDKPDYATLNLGFFRHLDRILALLEKKGLVAHLMIYVWNKKVNWAPPSTQADNLYFDYVIKRYQAYPNLIWDISKEALGYGHDDLEYINERIQRLRQLDGHRRLLTVHDYKYCRTYPGNVDFISVQEWRPNLFNEMLTALESHSKHPILNIEHGGYEKTRHAIFGGAYADALVCLDRAYQCLFAGVYSTHYWHNAAWYEVVYNPRDLPKQEQPKLAYYRHLYELFTRYPFNDLVPRVYQYAPFCLTNEKDHFLYYLPRGTISLEGALAPELRGQTVDLLWFNPLTGDYSSPERLTLGRGAGAWLGIKVPSEYLDQACLAILQKVTQQTGP